jgi:hypothetical protein
LRIEGIPILVAESSAPKQKNLDQPFIRPQILDSGSHLSPIISHIPLTLQGIPNPATEAAAKEYDAVRGEDQSPYLESATDSPIGSAHPMSSGRLSRPDSTMLDHTTESGSVPTPRPVALIDETPEASEEDKQSPMSDCPDDEQIDDVSIDVSVPTDSNLEEITNPRESSLVSDAYEPPEPRANPDGAASVYTPPFSPAPPDQLEPEEVEASSSSHLQADEALTGNAQVSNVISEPESGMPEVCCPSQYLNSPINITISMRDGGGP